MKRLRGKLSKITPTSLVLGIIFIIVVVVAIVFVYTSDKNKDSSSNNGLSSQNIESADSNPTQPHLDISQWGLRFYMTDSDKMTYSVKNASPTKGITSISLSLKKSVTSVAACQDLGTLERDPANPDTSLKHGVLDHITYYWLPSGTSCTTDDGVDDSVVQLRQQVLAGIDSFAFKVVELR